LLSRDIVSVQSSEKGGAGGETTDSANHLLIATFLGYSDCWYWNVTWRPFSIRSLWN